MAKVHCTWQPSMEGSHGRKPSFRMVRKTLPQRCSLLDSILIGVGLSVIWTSKMVLYFRWWLNLLSWDLHHPLMHFAKSSLSDVIPSQKWGHEATVSQLIPSQSKNIWFWNWEWCTSMGSRSCTFHSETNINNYHTFASSKSELFLSSTIHHCFLS